MSTSALPRRQSTPKKPWLEGQAQAAEQVELTPICYNETIFQFACLPHQARKWDGRTMHRDHLQPIGHLVSLPEDDKTTSALTRPETRKSNNTCRQRRYSRKAGKGKESVNTQKRTSVSALRRLE